MFDPYRRPTVAVIGAGPAGATAAAECSFSGFDTTLFDMRSQIGGHLTAPDAEPVSKHFRYRTPYLKVTKVDGSAASAARHLAAAVNAGGAQFRANTTVTKAAFNEGEGQWEVNFSGADGTTDTERFDILIRATGEASPWIEVPGRPNIAADDLYLHYGAEVVGLPNALFVDGPFPTDRALKRHPLAVFEARGDYARRYARQLEIRGPGALSVKRDKWLVQPGAVRGIRSKLSEFDPAVHTFQRASNYADEARKSARTHVG